jgi:hypothetical protein
VAQPALGISDPAATSSRLRKLYKAPVYPTTDANDEYTDALMRSEAEKLLFADKVEGDPTLWPDGVDRTFSGAPDVPNEVKTGGDGLPATAYSPNPAPPGPSDDGSVNIPQSGPTGQPDLQLPADGGKPRDVDGRRNPKTTSKTIADANKAGTIALGGSGTEPSIKSI